MIEIEKFAKILQRFPKGIKLSQISQEWLDKVVAAGEDDAKLDEVLKACVIDMSKTY